MYYFDKKSPFARHELGEVQSDFNMGLTIDGDKDSMQVQVYGYNENEVTPNTILFHSAFFSSHSGNALYSSTILLIIAKAG